MGGDDLTLQPAKNGKKRTEARYLEVSPFQITADDASRGPGSPADTRAPHLCAGFGKHAQVGGLEGRQASRRRTCVRGSDNTRKSGACN